MKRRKFLVGGALVSGSLFLPCLLQASALRPPVARMAPVSDVLWGKSITDPYRWMENPGDPDWLPFLRGQASYARQTLDALPMRAKLLKRISALSGSIAQATYPKIAGEMSFVQKREANALTYRIVAIDSAGRETVLADPADFAKVDASASIDWWLPSPDGKYLAFGVSLAGTEAAVGHVVDVTTGKRLDDALSMFPMQQHLGCRIAAVSSTTALPVVPPAVPTTTTTGQCGCIASDQHSRPIIRSWRPASIPTSP